MMGHPMVDSLFRDVTRFEVIDGSGRVYAIQPCKIMLSIQDQGRTLKVFVAREQEEK